jgi:hypothetical protein
MKPFTHMAIVLFSVISFAHILRLFFQWEIIVNGMTVPIWISVPGFLITAGIAFMLWNESHRQ